MTKLAATTSHAGTKAKHDKKEKKRKRERDLKPSNEDISSHETKKKSKKQNVVVEASKDRKNEDDKSIKKIQQHASRASKMEDSKDEVFQPTKVNFAHRYILAPMVGASELAFRLLCRRYGCQLAYTPMMSAREFAHDAEYRQSEFQTCAQDRPLVCHFWANDPQDLAMAAQQAQPFCDAIDLNLGCPQRTAFLGHFGSYLLDWQHRDLICSMIRAASRAVRIPIFCKIRLLDTLDETIQLCRDLRNAGCSLIAVHARYRASWERKGPGARDGPALLDHVTQIKKAITDIPIIANGNTVQYQDVEENLKLTGADGLMSAEGILDNPALFLPRLAPNKKNSLNDCSSPTKAMGQQHNNKMIRKINKKLRRIARIEKKVAANGVNSLMDEDQARLEKKADLEESLRNLTEEEEAIVQDSSLDELFARSENKILLAEEYLALATEYPVKMRSVIFHIRRMMKSLLEQYQLLEECLKAESIADVRVILQKIGRYEEDPQSFVFDQEKAGRDEEARQRRLQEEGKRQAFEARMRRKAKREGRSCLDYYLNNVGAELPTAEEIQGLQNQPRSAALALWKQRHSQHCLAFHLGECQRGRTCAFLHMDVLSSNAFDEKDEVAG